jgi:hypothetical protein
LRRTQPSTSSNDRPRDIASRTVSEVVPGVDAVSQALFGERVSVDYDANGVASVVCIDIAGAVGTESPIDLRPP